MEKRKLGEQLVITVDKKKHLMEEVEGWENHIREVCIVNEIGEVRRVFAKDLGPVNEDGFLREERSGQYPDIRHDKRNGVYEAYLHATLINPAMSAVLVRVQASSMDRLKEAWNRRV